MRRKTNLRESSITQFYSIHVTNVRKTKISIEENFKFSSQMRRSAVYSVSSFHEIKTLALIFTVHILHSIFGSFHSTFTQCVCSVCLFVVIWSCFSIRSFVAKPSSYRNLIKNGKLFDVFNSIVKFK